MAHPIVTHCFAGRLAIIHNNQSFLCIYFATPCGFASGRQTVYKAAVARLCLSFMAEAGILWCRHSAFTIWGSMSTVLATVVQVLVLFAGLSTCDPGNILDSIKAAKQQRVRASVIGLAAEVRICRVITDVRPSAVSPTQYVALPSANALHYLILNPAIPCNRYRGIRCCSQIIFCNAGSLLSVIYSPTYSDALVHCKCQANLAQSQTKAGFAVGSAQHLTLTRRYVQAVPVTLQHTWHTYVSEGLLLCLLSINFCVPATRKLGHTSSGSLYKTVSAFA